MTCIEMFAGAGGASLGLGDAGLDSAACVEYDPDAHATATAAGHPSVLADVRDFTRAWPGDPIDLLWASPPCQAFSSAGKRLGEADARNGWPWTLDAVDAVRPTWLIAENVPGLLHHQGACTRRDGASLGCAGCYWLGTVLPAFRVRFPHVEVRTLDAADYGIPQHRRRVFLVAGPRAIVWPEPTHGPGRAHPWASIGDALGVSAAPYYARAEQVGAVATPAAQPAPTLGRAGNVYLHATDPGKRKQGDVLTRLVPAPLAGSQPERLHRPSPTVSAVGECKGSGEGGNPLKMQRASDALFLGTGVRRLTPPLMAELMGRAILGAHQ